MMAGRSWLMPVCLLVVVFSASSAQPQYTVDSDLAAATGVTNDARSLGVQSKPVSIIFDNKRTIVNPGDTLSLDCGVSGEYRYCHWDNGRQPAIQVQDVYEGFIPGLSKPQVTKGNECGIVINDVTIEDHGAWTCNVFVIGNSLSDTKNVTVTIKPTRPVLEVPMKPLYVDEGDTETVSCSVAAARPKASIRWFLGDEDITYNSHVVNSLTDNKGTYKSYSTLTHTFKAWNNKKSLRCLVAHYTLETPLEDSVDITVRYKPWGKDVRLYGIQLFDDVEAKVNFSSNPEPAQVTWGYGLEFESIIADLPVPGEEDRYSTEMVTLEDGHYSVILRVLEFTEMDARMMFKVSVLNDLGVRDFRVTISNDKPPNDPLSNGALAGIVIVILLVILFLLCAVYMRYNHLFCFAQKKGAQTDKEANNTNSDTESAQSPGFVEGGKKSSNSIFGKLQSKVKKNKQQEAKSDAAPTEDSTAASTATVDEVVYAELELAAPEGKKSPPSVVPVTSPAVKAPLVDDNNEYAQIVGVLVNDQGKK